MRRAAVVVGGAGFALAAFFACADATTDPGTDAALHVQGGAQFWRGALPTENGGPKVLSAAFPQAAAESRNDLAAGGELDSTATGLAVGMDGDVGYWTVRGAIPSIGTPNAPTFDFGFGLAANLALGPHTITLRAVDNAGKFGPAYTVTLDVTARPLPQGKLVIALTWDSEADLDLHVALPDGVELYKRNTTEYQHPPPSAGPVDASAPLDGGYLDRDSNASCVLDGAREEDALWSDPPPSGHYIVRVDTFSLCTAASANWKVQAILNGVSVATAMGVATEDDLRFGHDRGAGVTAFAFDVP